MNTMITLDTPIKRGKQEIKEISVRKPNSGELRGVSLVELMQMEVGALHRVLPRITEPVLTEQEVANLDPADLFQFGTTITSFLLPRAMKLTVSLTE